MVKLSNLPFAVEATNESSYTAKSINDMIKGVVTLLYGLYREKNMGDVLNERIRKIRSISPDLTLSSLVLKVVSNKPKLLGITNNCFTLKREDINVQGATHFMFEFGNTDEIDKYYYPLVDRIVLDPTVASPIVKKLVFYAVLFYVYSGLSLNSGESRILDSILLKSPEMSSRHSITWGSSKWSHLTAIMKKGPQDKALLNSINVAPGILEQIPDLIVKSGDEEDSVEFKMYYAEREKLYAQHTARSKEFREKMAELYQLEQMRIAKQEYQNECLNRSEISDLGFLAKMASSLDVYNSDFEKAVALKEEQRDAIKSSVIALRAEIKSHIGAEEKYRHVQ